MYVARGPRLSNDMHGNKDLARHGSARFDALGANQKFRPTRRFWLRRRVWCPADSCQERSFMVLLPHQAAGDRREFVDDHQGKLSLHGDDIRGFAGTADGKAMHLFVLLETRLAVGLLPPVQIQAHQPAGDRSSLPVRVENLKPRFLRHAAALTETPTGRQASRISTIPRSASIRGCSMILISTRSKWWSSTAGTL